jgi:hypothetical protein
MVSLISPEENSYSFLLWPKMMTATSTEQRTESSCAFLNRPPLRLRKVLVHGVISFMFLGGGEDQSIIHRTVSIILDRLNLNLSAAHHELSGRTYCVYRDMSPRLSPSRKLPKYPIRQIRKKAGADRTMESETSSGTRNGNQSRERRTETLMAATVSRYSGAGRSWYLISAANWSAVGCLLSIDLDDAGLRVLKIDRVGWRRVPLFSLRNNVGG